MATGLVLAAVVAGRYWPVRLLYFAAGSRMDENDLLGNDLHAHVFAETTCDNLAVGCDVLVRRVGAYVIECVGEGLGESAGVV